MATTRSTQAHDKRVQEIADDAAAKVAADSPIEEDVVVVVEELPPGESTGRTQRGRKTQTQQEAGSAMFSMWEQSQNLIADGISRWTEFAAQFAASSGATELFSGPFDPRHITQEAFRLAEELLASQREFTFKVIDAMSSARAA